MTLTIAAALLVGLTAGPTRPAHWSALSTTASGITGDIILAPGRAVLGRKVFRLVAPVTINDFRADNGLRKAEVFAVKPAINPVLRNQNRLCTAPVRWIATWPESDGGLGMSAFSGAKTPTGVDAADACGTFYYVQPRR